MASRKYTFYFDLLRSVTGCLRLVQFVTKLAVEEEIKANKSQIINGSSIYTDLVCYFVCVLQILMFVSTYLIVGTVNGLNSSTLSWFIGTHTRPKGRATSVTTDI